MLNDQGSREWYGAEPHPAQLNQLHAIVVLMCSLRSGQVRSDQVRSGQVRSDQISSLNSFYISLVSVLGLSK